MRWAAQSVSRYCAPCAAVFQKDPEFHPVCSSLQQTIVSVSHYRTNAEEREEVKIERIRENEHEESEVRIERR